MIPNNKKNNFEYKSHTVVQDNTYVAPKVVMPLKLKKKQQFVPREQPVLKADTRTDRERKIAQEYTESVLNPSISTQIGETLQKPLRWIADPVKGIGDIVSAIAPNSALGKYLPNTNAETFEYRKKRLNPYTSNKEKINSTISEAIPLTNWALLNTLPVEAAAGNVVKSGKNLIKPVSKVVDKTDDVIKARSKVLNKTDDAIKFKSEIDWGSWNSEIPKNTKLIKEYNAIEQSAKTNGTWMNNSDGSIFNGTPEQFIQQNSENFKKAFPNGHDILYRGVTEPNALLINNPKYKSVFTGDRNLAKHYSNSTNIATDKNAGIYELYSKNTPNDMNIDAFGSTWNDINLQPKDKVIKNMEQIYNNATNRANNNKNELIADLLNNYKLHSKNRYERAINLNDDRHIISEYMGDGSVSTDMIAHYIDNENIGKIRIKDVNDGANGNVTIASHRPGNYLKSMFGNNGMFDMTNPNIYKVIIPPALFLGFKSKIKKNNNELYNNIQR